MNTILVVDDDKPSRILLREILTPAGYQIVEAIDGQDALDLLSKLHVDLVITDRAMPRMDGLQLLAKLRERHGDVPAVMISAFGEESLWGTAIGLGAQDYVLKPFKQEEVLSLVKKILSKKKS